MTETSSTIEAARNWRRRELGRLALGAGMAAVAAPWVGRHAAAAGVVKVYAWSDYVYQDMIDSFQKETGLDIELSKFGSNDELFNKLKASGGAGFDLVMPTTTEGPQWYDAGDLLQPLDESKIDIEAIYPSIYERSVDLGGTYRGKRYILPFNWGTEGMTYDSSAFQASYGTLSLGDLWRPEMVGKATVRQKSALIAIGRTMDAEGKLKSNGMLDAYKDKETSRRIFDQIVPVAIELKKNIKKFWNSADDQYTAFNQDGCVIGLTWDGPGIVLSRTSGGRIRYLMPKEGGFAWLDGMSIPTGAENVEGAYAFINHMYRADMGAAMANQSGYNSVVAEAVPLLKPEAKAAFEAAYPEGAVDNLWWWPMVTPWFNPVRTEYVEKYTAA
ncbi:extracellular solute-binding protein [Geminicoccus harenae]|uniref:extracellular solute-binding protein n=1 Tax=Geminicoccus harenae TaxID=2498453 RepID=UPI001C9434FC|nr:extracellular solute-binding protein [Geminicoccus harenae]